MKLSENNNWVTNNRDKNTGAMVVLGLGIKKTSFVNILNKSASICKEPLRPISVGPIRRSAKASSLRSNKTTNSVKSTTNKDDIIAISCKV